GNTGVSLVDSLVWQIGRNGGGPFNFGNEFWSLVRSDWLPRDAVLLVGGALATLLNIVRGARMQNVAQRRALATGLLGVLPLLYLARGGIVFDFYILFAIPFLCLNLVVLLAPLSRRLPTLATTGLAVGLALALGVGYLVMGLFQPLYAQSPSTSGRGAVAWIKAHVPPDAYILTGDDLWTDLREPGFDPGSSQDAPGFPNVQSYTKVGGDPAIRTGVFNDDWHNVDYLIVSPGLEDSLVAAGNTVALDALHNAHPVQSWTSDGSSLELWKVDKVGVTEPDMLSASDSYLADHFDHSGAFMTADGTVTSESQAYALLRAVWSDDRAGFNRTWQWTSGHMTNSAGLLAWKWSGTVQDSDTASDADADAALALLMASRKWDDQALLADGTAMVDAIWNHDVTMVNGTPYVVAGDWAADSDVLAINPSYFAPYAYHIFQEVDPNQDHNWLGVVDSGYEMLFNSSAGTLGGDQSAGLPPDWVGLDRTTGSIVPLSLGADLTTVYSYDAPRAYWRVALDQRWDNDGRAAAYLAQAGFLDDEVNRAGDVRAIYTHDGAVASNDSSTVGSAGALAALLSLDPNAANRLYADSIVGGSESSKGQVYWGDANDLYAQEWGWFATAVYADALTDVWHGGT
ncbi:MAG TPA: glycosyl hydrolase family 8, partial [Chloroflexota bacterium]